MTKFITWLRIYYSTRLMKSQLKGKLRKLNQLAISLGVISLWAQSLTSKNSVLFEEVFSVNSAVKRKGLPSGGLLALSMEDLPLYLRAFTDENGLTSLEISTMIIGCLLLPCIEAEDRERYRVLINARDLEQMAKKTIKRQMRSVFLSPIILAVIYKLAANRIISIILQLFGIGAY